MESSGATYWMTRIVFQRALAFVYFIAFLIAVNQIRPLIGEHGLLPAQLFLKRVRFWDAPSLFWIHSSDTALLAVSIAGLMLSIAALYGLSESFGIYVSAGVWFFLWLFYLSIVNAGQTFYGFGWETLLLETGFLAIFLGSRDAAPPKIIFWLYRWLCFRIMFGAGMIKIRGDECWRDLTCLNYHYETQPLPNPLSWHAHRLPAWFHKGEVLFTHFVELIAPWGLFVPGLVGYGAAALTISFQFILILSGNLSWLNYATLILAIPCFDDSFFSKFLPFEPPQAVPIANVRLGIISLLSASVLLLSIRPAVNLFSKRQLMNASFEPLHLVNTYGAFGSVTKIRNEIILQGTDEAVITDSTKWKDYDFKGKPGDPSRMPCVVSPYHWKLDWQMWFAAMSPYYYHPWIVNLTAKLLENDRGVLSLLAGNPFPERPPKFIRAELYEYHFTRFRKENGNWWARTYVRPYLPPISLNNPEFKQVLEEQGWLKT